MLTNMSHFFSFFFHNNNNNKFDMCLTKISHYFSFCSFLFTSPRKKYNFFYMFHVTRFSILFIIKRWCVTLSYFYYILTFLLFYAEHINFYQEGRLYFVWNTKRKVNHIPDSLNWLTMISRLNSLGMLVEIFFF